MLISFKLKEKMILAKVFYDFGKTSDLVVIKLVTSCKDINGCIVFSRNNSGWDCENQEMKILFPQTAKEINAELQKLFYSNYN